MYSELWLWPYAFVMGSCVSAVLVAHGPRHANKILSFHFTTGQVRGQKDLEFLLLWPQPQSSAGVGLCNATKTQNPVKDDGTGVTG